MNLGTSTYNSIINSMPGVYYIIKSIKGVYLEASDSVFSHFGGKENVIGKRVEEIQSASSLGKYILYDNYVSENGSMCMQIDKSTDLKGNIVWTMFSRFVSNHELYGPILVGVSQKLPDMKSADKAYGRLKKSTEFIRDNLRQKISITDLAEASSCSVATLERDFSRVFQMTPQQYHNAQRINYAKHLLSKSIPYSDVALECGYSDQSAFCRAFKRVTSVSAREYVTA